jgi:hypothetical protein
MLQLKSILSIAFVVVMLVSCSSLLAQKSTSSLYSHYGLGDLQSPGFAKNLGMGGLSATVNGNNAINIGNPASYSSIELTTFEAGMASNFAKYKTTDNAVPTDVTNTTMVRYMAFAFPVSKKWGASVGLVPYSYVGYETGYTQNTGIGNAHYFYKGTGGVNQFYIGNAYKFSKNFSLGANVSYLFGNITKQKSVAFESDANAMNTLNTTTYNVGDFNFNYGALYTSSISTNFTMAVGLTGALNRNMNTVLNAINLQYFEKNGVSLSRDTGGTSVDAKGKVLIPGYLGGGISFSKTNVWMAGIEYQLQNWSKYTAFGKTDSMTNSSKVIFGAEYIHSRFQYRVGARYQETNLMVNTQQIKEYAVSAGLGIPISRAFSYINIAAELAERGALSNGLIREHYLRIMLGLTLSDRWFIQRKFD